MAAGTTAGRRRSHAMMPHRKLWRNWHGMVFTSAGIVRLLVQCACEPVAVRALPWQPMGAVAGRMSGFDAAAKELLTKKRQGRCWNKGTRDAGSGCQRSGPRSAKDAVTG